MKKFFIIVSQVSGFAFYSLLFLLLFLFSPSWFFLPLGILLALSFIVVYSLKRCFPTTRPKKERGSLPKKRTLWNDWVFVDRSSFPSAHATLTGGLFSLSWFFSWELSLMSLSFLLVVMLARVRLKEHHWKDVIVGAVIGMVLGFLSWQLAPLVSGPFTCTDCINWSY